MPRALAAISLTYAFSATSHPICLRLHRPSPRHPRPCATLRYPPNEETLQIAGPLNRLSIIAFEGLLLHRSSALWRS